MTRDEFSELKKGDQIIFDGETRYVTCVVGDCLCLGPVIHISASALVEPVGETLERIRGGKA